MKRIMTGKTETTAEPRSLDLNFTDQRAKIEHEMAEACMPYLVRLQNLETLQKLLDQQIDGDTTPDSTAPETPPRRSPRKPEIMNEGPYARSTQSAAIIDIVTKKPGLDVHGIADSMLRGGYRFTSASPTDTMHVALRSAVRRGDIRQVDPAPEERILGARNRYYPTSESESRPRHVSKKRATSHNAGTFRPGGMTEAVFTAIQGSGPDGLNRNDILSTVLQNGYIFDETTSSAEPAQRLNWALQALVDRGRIQRRGFGVAAMFSTAQ